MINVAGNFFDLTSCIGYEFWSQNNTRPKDWHIDKDEQMKANTGQTRFPLCSVVYYVKVDKLKGGKLHVEDDIVTPKSNRMVIFSPKLNHCVEPHMGKSCPLCKSLECKIMIHDFISVYDNSLTSDECEYYINLIEHYISNGLITKEERHIIKQIISL